MPQGVSSRCFEVQGRASRTSLCRRVRCKVLGTANLIPLSPIKERTRAMPTFKRRRKLIWNEAFWRDRAEEAYSISQEIRNPECRRIMREISHSCQYLARLPKHVHHPPTAP